MWGHGITYEMGWWMWVLMILGTIGFWVVVGYVVVAVVRGRPAPAMPDRSPSGSEPLRLLDERLARGDLDAEEYQRTRNLLTHAS